MRHAACGICGIIYLKRHISRSLAPIEMPFGHKVHGHKGFKNLEFRRERRDRREDIRRKPLFFGVKGLEGQLVRWGKNPFFCAKFMIFSTSGPNFKSNRGLVGSIFHFPCGQFFAVFRRRDGLGRIYRRRVHRLG